MNNVTLFRRHYEGKGGTAHSKLVELAKRLQPSIVICIAASGSVGRRCHGSTRARRELVRHRASQYVLTEFLDFVVNHGLNRVACDEAQHWPADLGEKHLAGRSLHLDAQDDAVYGSGGFIVHSECAGERLAELDRPERGWESQESRRIGQITQCLGVPWEGRATL